MIDVLISSTSKDISRVPASVFTWILNRLEVISSVAAKVIKSFSVTVKVTTLFTTELRKNLQCQGFEKLME